MSDLGLLILRLVSGGLLAGHGAQKLFGSFGGHGLEGTAGWLESLGLRPGHMWAGMAGVGELGGGMLTALGAGGPLGSILSAASMGMATVQAHWGKPIWATSGGAELPVVNIAVATALALTGPGKYSVDRLFGVRVPVWFSGLTTIAALGTLIVGLLSEPEPSSESAESEAAGA
jgi:putative oxidoreductase